MPNQGQEHLDEFWPSVAPSHWPWIDRHESVPLGLPITSLSAFEIRRPQGGVRAPGTIRGRRTVRRL